MKSGSDEIYLKIYLYILLWYYSILKLYFTNDFLSLFIIFESQYFLHLVLFPKISVYLNTIRQTILFSSVSNYHIFTIWVLILIFLISQLTYCKSPHPPFSTIALYCKAIVISFMMVSSIYPKYAQHALLLFRECLLYLETMLIIW